MKVNPSIDATKKKVLQRKRKTQSQKIQSKP